MGLFGKSTSKQTAKLKSLVKLAAARLAVARRPRLRRRSIARSDVGQLLSIGHLDRALVRVSAHLSVCSCRVCRCLSFCQFAVVIRSGVCCRRAGGAGDRRGQHAGGAGRHRAPLQNPHRAGRAAGETQTATLVRSVESRECSEEIKEAAAGLMFASARCGELPELLDARAILADKFGRNFARAAKEGAHGVVDPTLVRKLSGERASLEQKRRLAKGIAAENDILLEFPENPVEIHQDGRTTSQINSQRASEQTKNAPARIFDEESAVKTDRREGERNSVNGKVNPSLAQLSLDEKVLRESKKYPDVRMAAEAAFASAKFAAMAARAAVELSRSESHGKGSRGGGGYNKVPSVLTTAATEQGTAPPSWRPHKSPSPSWSDRSTATSVGSDAAHRGKEVVFDQSDEKLEDEVTEDLVWPPSQRRPSYWRTASTVGTGVGPWHGDAGSTGAPGNNTPPHAHQQHRRHATEFAASNALHDSLAGGQRGQYVTPPYRRTSTASTGRDSGAARDDGGAYESSSYVHPPY
ncbi:uncharacterized protein [Miscanthus floridulus]|uniref:uncharacterized protein n=1 Tax=Miscanthus floridulus TaxID=154761 RepID=UPI00345745A5